jgi:hypothetical protein
MVFTGEHADGYGVELWDADGQLAGLLYRAAGLAQDIPVGQLEDIRYNPKDRTLSFKARLSIGVATVNGDSWEPTRDIYQFQGTLFPDQLTGELMHGDRLHSDRPLTSESVKLYRDEKLEKQTPQPKSYSEWAEGLRIKLQARGPKW